MIFERLHHRRIASALTSFDGDVLRKHRCFFGGGTAIALSANEFRESIDIDFLVDDTDAYRDLRELVRGPGGIPALTRPGALFHVVADVRIDQYGIRTALGVDDTRIKFEIVREARIRFEDPAPSDDICGVPRLSTHDLATSKLLANADRYADDSVQSRDLIDLAMLNLPRKHLNRAIERAQRAYPSVERDLELAIAALARRPGRLQQCMANLRIIETPPALLWQRIKRLKRRAPSRSKPSSP